MTDLKLLGRSLQWYEGMLLLPHHFQYASRRLEDLSMFHAKKQNPFYWGVDRFAIDDGLLVSGRLRITDLVAVMPDGLLLNFDPDVMILDLDLTPYKDMLAQGPMMVYLAVPSFRANDANVEGPFPRYDSIPSCALLDFNTGDNETKVPLLQPKVSLFIGDQPPARYISLPFAQVSYKDEVYRLTDYIPPIVTAQSHPSLVQVLLGITKILREKANFLADKSKNYSGRTMILEYENVLKVITEALIFIEPYLLVPVMSPFDLYLATCHLAAILSALKSGNVPPIFKPYDHNNIKDCFNQVLSFIYENVQSVQEGYMIVPFVQKDRLFTLKIDESFIRRGLITLGAKTSTTMTESELSQWVSGAVIATDTHVRSVCDKRILGARRDLAEGDEEMSLLPSKGVIIFTVMIDPQFIIPGETLHIFNFSDDPQKRPIEIVAYVSKQKTTVPNESQD